MKSPAKFTPNEIGLIIEREWLRLVEAWPGVKPITRASASTLNRIAQLIAGPGAVRASREAAVDLIPVRRFW